MNFAPIVLFTFNRLGHTEQTIEALKKNKESLLSELIIYSDGPRSEKDIEKVTAVRNYLKTVSGFKSVKIFESQINKGLAKSIISGVTQTLKNYETVIILEDDMVTSSYFLSYMNQGLMLYRNDEVVASIHGYFFPVGDENLPETFFIKGADCWGWATWRRSWKYFEPNGWKLLMLILLSGRQREFDFNNSYGYTRMLFSQCIGRINSWAIRWYASAFLRNKLTLYPRVSLVKNIGFDDMGTHTRPWHKKAFDTTITDASFLLKKIEIKESETGRTARANYFKKHHISYGNKIAYSLSFFFKKMTEKI